MWWYWMKQWPKSYHSLGLHTPGTLCAERSYKWTDYPQWRDYWFWCERQPPSNHWSPTIGPSWHHVSHSVWRRRTGRLLWQEPGTPRSSGWRLAQRSQGQSCTWCGSPCLRWARDRRQRSGLFSSGLEERKWPEISMDIWKCILIVLIQNVLWPLTSWLLLTPPVYIVSTYTGLAFPALSTHNGVDIWRGGVTCSNCKTLINYHNESSSYTYCVRFPDTNYSQVLP